jgi:hypothetical protein
VRGEVLQIDTLEVSPLRHVRSMTVHLNTALMLSRAK